MAPGKPLVGGAPSPHRLHCRTALPSYSLFTLSLSLFFTAPFYLFLFLLCLQLPTTCLAAAAAEAASVDNHKAAPASANAQSLYRSLSAAAAVYNVSHNILSRFDSSSSKNTSGTVATTVRDDERYFVPERAMKRESRVVGRFTSMLDASVQWRTPDEEEKVLRRLFGRRVASGSLASLPAAEHEQASYSSKAVTARREEGEVATATAVRAEKEREASPNGAHAVKVEKTARRTSAPTLSVVYTKALAGASGNSGEMDGENSKEDVTMSSSAVWEEIRSRSPLNEVRTRLLTNTSRSSSGNDSVRAKVSGTPRGGELLETNADGSSGPVTPSLLAELPQHVAETAALANTHATETLIEIHQKKARVPIKMLVNQITAIAVEATAGNVVNMVMQFPNPRFDEGVGMDNCRGMSIGWEVRLNNPYGPPAQFSAREAAATAFPHASSNDNIGNKNDNADADEDDSEGASNVWNSFAQMFDTSAFCEVKSSYGMRIPEAKRTRTYYYIVHTRAFYNYYHDESAENATCQLVFFVDQTPGKMLRALQIIFALVVPLLLLFVPLPFQLWRGDIIQTTMMDIDFADWIFYPPILLRRKIKGGCLSLYTNMKTCIATRRAKRQQAKLAVKQRQLAKQMQAQFEASRGNSSGHTKYNDGSDHTATVASDANSQGMRGTTDPVEVSAVPTGWGAGRRGWGSPNFATDANASKEAAVAATTVELAYASSTRPHWPPARNQAVNDLLNDGRQAPVQPTPFSYSADAEDPLLKAMEPAAAAASRAEGADGNRDADNDPHNSSSSSSVRLQDSFTAASMAQYSQRQEQLQESHAHLSREEREQNLAERKAGNGNSVTSKVASAALSTRDLLYSADVGTRQSHSDDFTKAVDIDSPVRKQREEQEEGESASCSAGERCAHRLSDAKGQQDARSGSDRKQGDGAEAVGEDEEEEERFCRICREDDSEEALVAPCACTGSVRWVHRSCLDHWRLESAKRNLNNVNKCEICKQDFTIGIRKSTMFLRSASHVVDVVLLFLTSFFAIFMITTLSHSTFGELSCLADYHDVSYKTMYLFEGLTLSVFLYLLCLILVLFSTLIVHSWFRSRADVEAYIQETHMMPPFLTSRNVALILMMSGLLTLQGLSLGYLVKLFLYVTSDNAWNWEASPLLGGLLFMLFMTLSLGCSVYIRDVSSGARSARVGQAGAAEEVVVVAAQDADVDATAAAQNINDDRDSGNNGEGAAAAHEERERDTAGDESSGIEDRQANETGSAGGVEAAASDGNHHHHHSEAAAAHPSSQQPQPGQAGDEDYTGQFAIPPDQRVIRAFEYCPPRRTTRF